MKTEIPQTRQAAGTALIREASLPADSAALMALIQEYVAWLNMDLSYRGFAHEMANFNTRFTRPSGFFLLAEVDEQLAGCVGLLRHTEATAEVKRLYVRPAFRGCRLGERLLRVLIREAGKLGHEQLVLDAVPQTKFAQTLYRSMGFQEIEPYYANPVGGTKFFGLPLIDRQRRN
jgi:putative acetyltransferase